MSKERKQEIKRQEQRKEAWSSTRKTLWKPAGEVLLALVGLFAAYHLSRVETAGFLAIIIIPALWWLAADVPIAKYLTPNAPLRILVALLASVVTIAILYPFYREERGRQHAALMTGVLEPLSKGTATKPMMQLQDDTELLDMSVQSDDQGIRFLQDEHLKLELKDGVILISTIIRDKDGKVLVKLDKNHWEVTPAVMDKNYTQDALEVKDARDRVVFRARVLPDRVQIQGEWRDDTGHGIRWSAGPPGMSKIASPHMMLGVSILRPRSEDPQGIGDAIGRIEPLFLYPSSEHWGELRKNH